MLFIFLPPLVFGEAMSLNWYYAMGGYTQALLLAGPGVIIGSYAFGSLIYLFLNIVDSRSGWNWYLSMIMGSILSATDTVSVVSLLKQLGASPKLTMVVTGESLFNDGSAMVLFTIYFNFLKDKAYTADQIISFIFKDTLGSLSIGVAFGLVCFKWLKTANRPLKEVDITSQISITLCFSYLIFFITEYSLELSGILACVSAGAVLACFAPPVILNQESLHNFWHIIEWGLNTLIFLLSGLIIGHRVLSKVNVVDYFYCLLFYLLLNVCRFFTIFFCYPLLSRIGHKCSFEEAIFISWSGLRGALGMALALMVENGGPEEKSEEASRLFFYVGGIAALTLVINATLSRPLLFYLGLLTSDSPEKIMVMNQIKKKLRKQMNNILKDIVDEFKLEEKDVEDIRMSCSLLMEAPFNASSFFTDNPQKFGSISIQNSHHSNSIQSDQSEFITSILSDAYNMSNLGKGFGNSNGILSRGHSMSFSGGISRSRSFSTNNYNASKIIKLNNMLTYSINTKLSVADSPVIISELLLYIRLMFLECVRVKYWNLIELGKLPRQSYSAKYLLYTIDAAIDSVDSNYLLSKKKNGLEDDDDDDDDNHTENRKSQYENRGLCSWFWNFISPPPPSTSSASQLNHRRASTSIFAPNHSSVLKDWEFLEDDITSVSLFIKTLRFLNYFFTKLLCWIFRIPFDYHENISSYSNVFIHDKHKKFDPNQDNYSDIGSYSKRFLLTRWLYHLVNKYEARAEKRNVYMLISFIEAHKHAQKKIHDFLGLSVNKDEEDKINYDVEKNGSKSDDDKKKEKKQKKQKKDDSEDENRSENKKSEEEDDYEDKVDDDNDDDDDELSSSMRYYMDNSEDEDQNNKKKKNKKRKNEELNVSEDEDDDIDDYTSQNDLSLEEYLVIKESKAAVKNAKKMLNLIPRETFLTIRSKQASRLVLSYEADLVKEMVKEGLLSMKHAEEFLHDINKDTSRIENERTKMYKEQAEKRKQKLLEKLEQEEERKKREEEGLSGRESIFTRSSLFSFFSNNIRPQHKNFDTSTSSHIVSPLIPPENNSVDQP